MEEKCIEKGKRQTKGSGKGLRKGGEIQERIQFK
jgi:hypothetical protein